MVASPSRCRRSPPGRDRGAAVVEMALVMPLLLLMLFGLIDFGRVFNAKIQLSQAAREGVRLAALNSTSDPSDPSRGTAAISARVAAAAPSPVGGGPPSATPTYCAASTITYPVAQVVVSLPFTFITPLGEIASYFGGGNGLPHRGSVITLASTGVMRCVL